ncbi:hypothetical protein C0W54_09740 [Photobacterium kishitanii]|uniref:GGDEF domain-containing protein n=1 Tax=Photobacterium kishitanii TaxID=318456 RepID=UPI000D16F0FC|nr:GGDEF domain-containing protein [Photobacterium kishitanii]PSW61634.1 hypothetical protein C0W54_09740 [Photobacterium kishitanii]
MLTLKGLSSNCTIYRNIAIQLTVCFLFIYIIFQTLIEFKFFDKDTLNAIHNHSMKINILFFFTLLFVFCYLINCINKWFINPLNQLKEVINDINNISNNKTIHENDIINTFEHYCMLIKELAEKDSQIDLEISMLTKEKHSAMRQKQLTSSILNNSQDVIIIIDSDGIIKQVSPSFCQLIGVKYEHVIHQPLIKFINTAAYKNIKASLSHELNNSHQWQGEFNVQHAINKKNIPVYVKINKFTDHNKNNNIQYSIIATDLTTIKEIDRLIHINHHDTLTGLPNRTALSNRLNAELKMQYTAQHKFAVLFIDLDNFKRINDNYGHQTGDKVLKVTANKLRNSVKKNDMIARLAGDEFIAIINPAAGHEDVLQTCERILSVLQQPIIIEKHRLTINASLGCYYAHPNKQQTIDEILSQADIAMYKAKIAGKGCIIECNSF